MLIHPRIADNESRRARWEGAPESDSPLRTALSASTSKGIPFEVSAGICFGSTSNCSNMEGTVFLRLVRRVFSHVATVRVLGTVILKRIGGLLGLSGSWMV